MAKIFLTRKGAVVSVNAERYHSRPELYKGWRDATKAEIEKKGFKLEPVEVEVAKPKKRKKSE